METSALVTLLKDDFAPDWSRPKILDVIDKVQHMLFDQDCVQTIFQDTSATATFPIPFLHTTTGTLEYEVTNANLSTPITINSYATTCRRVKDVFIKISSPYTTDYSRQFLRENFDYGFVNPWYSKALDSVTFQKCPARFIDQRGIQNARIIFPEDPGTHTDRYYVEFFLNPVSLVSENIPLTISADQWFDVVLDGCVGYIEEVGHGRSERWERFRTQGMPRYWGSMNKGDENKPLQIGIHEC